MMGDDGALEAHRPSLGAGSVRPDGPKVISWPLSTSLRLLSPARVEPLGSVSPSTLEVAGVGNTQRAHTRNWHRRGGFFSLV